MKRSSVDLLLGADIFHKKILPDNIEGHDNEPVAINIKFGYILMNK